MSRFAGYVSISQWPSLKWQGKGKQNKFLMRFVKEKLTFLSASSWKFARLELSHCYVNFWTGKLRSTIFRKHGKIFLQIPKMEFQEKELGLLEKYTHASDSKGFLLYFQIIKNFCSFTILTVLKKVLWPALRLAELQIE